MSLSLAVCGSLLVMAFVFWSLFLWLAKGEYFLGSSFGISFYLFWKVFSSFFGFLLPLTRTVLRQLATSPWNFSFSSHIEDLGLQVIIFEWAPLDRVVKFCFVFSFLQFVSP